MGKGFCYACMAIKRVETKMTTFTGKYFPKAIKEVHEVEWPLREWNEALERGRKAKDEEPLVAVHRGTAREEEEEMELEEEEEEERRRRRIVEDEFEDVSWETLDEDARANLYYYVVDNFLTAEHFSCYPLEEDEIQPPQSSDDDWLWSPATGWQRAREVDAESVAA